MANNIQAFQINFLITLSLLLGLVSAGYRNNESCIEECGLLYLGTAKGLHIDCHDPSKFNGSSFKKDFLFGTATSAYQIEGAAHREMNIWDSFTHYFPEKTTDGSNGDLACDSYHLFEKDVELMVEMGLKSYRFSIAWSRVLPKGRGKTNPDGIQYYHKLLKLLKRNNIEPFVTLFHWDLPQTLEDEYGGFLNRTIVDDFKGYADLCFREFGHIVKHWITLNQPYTVSLKGFGNGEHAPGRCSSWQNLNCLDGDSGTEPYKVAHHQILAHATAVHLYRDTYQKNQSGIIGTTLIDRWFTPYNDSDENDIKATQRAQDFFFGWFMEPMVRGDYPQIMKDLVGNRLPRFNKNESDFVKQTLDFVGVNYYFAQYVKNVSSEPDPTRPCVLTDPRVNLTFFRNGRPIGPPGYDDFYSYPVGIRDILEYIKDNYGNPRIFITENGFKSNGTLPLPQILNDDDRIDYHCSHLCFLRCAVLNGSRIDGYFAWSLVDNYEFGDGFTARFGMNYVDFKNVSDRQNKSSATWYTKFVEGNIPKNQDNLVEEI